MVRMEDFSIALAVDAPRAHFWAISMAFVVDTLMDLAGAGLYAFEVDSPTTHAEVFVSMDSAIDASVTSWEADS